MADKALWWQISDLHWPASPTDERKLFADSFIERLTARILPEHGEPNFIAFTGDIKKSGQADEYNSVLEHFLNPLMNAFPGVPVFGVPGNHDMNWKQAESQERSGILPIESSANLDRPVAGAHQIRHPQARSPSVVLQPAERVHIVRREGMVAGAGRLRVVSLNLRGPDDDEPNRWPGRLPVVAGLFRDWRPDLVGTQEGLYSRLDDLAEEVGELGYRWIGLGREGGSRSEFVAIFYRHDRFRPVAFDHFWLSPSPRTAGSVLPGWWPATPRMVTWARFRERATGRELVHVNTHLDNRSGRARRRGAELIAAFVAPLVKAGDRVILTGDFNAPAVSSTPYKILTRRLADTWPADGTERPATFHGYRHPSLRVDGKLCIDWILASPGLSPRHAEVLAATKPGPGGPVYPSDHWPVLADLQ